MKLHPRAMLVLQAHNDIDEAVSNAMKKHPDMTYFELLQILNQISASWLKYAIRDERHPDDPDKRGGEE